MKIFTINESARKLSNTGDMIDIVLSQLNGGSKEIEKINLHDKTAG